MCKLLLEQGKANVDEQSLKNCTALIYSARGGYDQLIDLFLSHKANPQHQDASGATALHHAGEKNFPIVIEKLIKAGIDSNIQDLAGRTALITSVLYNSKQALDTLLASNADTNAVDYFGHTALFYAARDDSLEMVQKLIEKGNADPNLYSMPNQGMEKEMKDKEGQSASDKLNILALNNSRVPIHAAAANGHLDILEYLLGKGARATEPGRNNNNALHLASLCGQIMAAKILIKAGLDLTSKNTKGQSATDILKKYYPTYVDELIELSQRQPEHAIKVIEGEFEEQEKEELSMCLENMPGEDEDVRLSTLRTIYGENLAAGIFVKNKNKI